jgi:hypothetical protein
MSAQLLHIRDEAKRSSPDWLVSVQGDFLLLFLSPDYTMLEAIVR